MDQYKSRKLLYEFVSDPDLWESSTCGFKIFHNKKDKYKRYESIVFALDGVIHYNKINMRDEGIIIDFEYVT